MEKLNILVSLITDQNDYQLEQAASAQVAASRIGANLQIIYANNDAVQQTQQILEFIQNPNKRPDAILVEPVGTGMPQVAKAAVSAGIAWVLINSKVEYLSQLRQHATVPVFSMISDHEAIGRIQGQQMAAILGEQGCVLYIEGPAVRDVSRLRTKGMMATKPAGIKLKTLKGDWTRQSGYHAVKSWLSLSTSRELHVGLISCQNDDMAMGARQAFEEMGDLKERDSLMSLPITGCDGVPKAGQTWVKQGRITATIFCPPLLGNAIQLLSESHRNGSQPDETTLSSASSFPALDDLTKKRAAAASKA